METKNNNVLNMIEAIAKITRRFHPKGTERLLRLFYSPDKRQNDFLETIIPYDKDLKIHIDTRALIEWQIFFKGYYEKHITDLIKRKLPKNGVFVDVGANIGCHTLIISKIAKKVIAIEPVEMIRNRLLANLKLNDINNVIIEPTFISDYIGMTSFFLPKENISGQELGSFSKNENSGEEIKVPVITLDELLKNEERIDFIKIDVEGHSKQVISGAKEIIKKFNPFIIYEEDNSDKMVIMR